MSSFWDLEPCDYFDRQSEDDPQLARKWSDSLRAIGWLGSELDFPVGPVPSDTFEALRDLASEAWQPTFYLGSHYCGLCVRAAGGYLQDFLASEAGQDLSRSGSTNLFVPGNGFVYAAPVLILHYISEHQYQPPAEFCAAVMDCPHMNSADYFKALRRNATGDFAKVVPAAPWWRFWNRSPLSNEELKPPAAPNSMVG